MHFQTCKLHLYTILYHTLELRVKLKNTQDVLTLKFLAEDRFSVRQSIHDHDRVEIIQNTNVVYLL